MHGQAMSNLHVEKGGGLRTELSLIMKYNCGNTGILQNTDQAGQCHI